MPKPVGSGQRYMPGLDGLRAIAVLAVIAFHEQFSWAPGGLLGVGVFFTLSGYLITDLLLNRWLATGRVQLGEVLAGARPPPAACAVRHAGGRHGVGHAPGPGAPGQPARRGGCRSHLLQQLVPHSAGPVVLLALRAAAATRPSLVARRRGAVLPDLAVAAAARTDLHPAAHARPRSAGSRCRRWHSPPPPRSPCTCSIIRPSIPPGSTRAPTPGPAGC